MFRVGSAWVLLKVLKSPRVTFVVQTVRLPGPSRVGDPDDQNKKTITKGYEIRITETKYSKIRKIEEMFLSDAYMGV